MGFNPLKEKGIPIEDQVHNWGTLNVQPYNKIEVDPFTRTRIILMNGIEVESAIFMHQFARHTDDADLKRKLALARRIEQQQQKMVNWLVPADENVLEVTIGYEQVAVDLTAYLARTEPDPYVKAALDFALLEDFDHLYRYANLLMMEYGIPAHRILGEYTEATPGRPTMEEHRHPFDEVRKPYDAKTAQWLTKLHVETIIAAEQQTMNYYMNIGPTYHSPLGRGLYQEIAQIEEQHVTHYESLADPTTSWFEMLLLHDYNEAYLYWSCMQSETDERIKAIWESHLRMEIEHLHMDRQLMQQYEKRDAAEILPDEFPEPTIFQNNKAYVREVLAQQVDLTGKETEFVPVSKLPRDSRYQRYQDRVHGDGMVPSRDVITNHIDRWGADYRVETEGENPVQRLRRQQKRREPVHA